MTIPLLKPGEVLDDAAVEALAASIGSDGCSGVPDFYRCCCVVHDLAYKFRMDPWGRPVRTKKTADKNFRKCIQGHSRLGVLSPMSWWRWLGVKRFGQRPWDGHRKREEEQRQAYGLPPYEKGS